MNRHFLRFALTSIAAIALTAPLAAQQGRGTVARPFERKMADDSGPRPQAFSVSLVLGEMQASGGSDNVPPAARKALTDVKDFLPYKGYRLLDSQWTICCGRSPIITRLRGPEDQDYALELNPSNAGGGKYYVHFSLWEPRGVGEAADVSGSSTEARSLGVQRTNLDMRRVALQRQLEEMKKNKTEDHPEAAQLRAELDALDQQIAAGRQEQRRIPTPASPRRAVIDTSFTMDIGETVVVGTSRLKGDKALIALLTAVAPTKSPAK